MERRINSLVFISNFGVVFVFFFVLGKEVVGELGVMNLIVGSCFFKFALVFKIIS